MSMMQVLLPSLIVILLAMGALTFGLTRNGRTRRLGCGAAENCDHICAACPHRRLHRNQPED